MADASSSGATDLLDRPWFFRRLAVFGTMLFCAGIVIYLARWGVDDALHRDMNNLAWVCLIGALNSYVFGAAWDDRDLRKRVAQISGNAAPDLPPPPAS